MSRCRPQRRILLIAALACGCGVDSSSFDQRRCDGGELQLLDDISPATPVDYVELRAVPMGVDSSPPDREVLDVHGVRCASASDPEACADAFDALPLDSLISRGEFFSISEVSLAWTRGDEARVASSQPEVLQLLDVIDTPGEAALWAELDRQHELVCDGRDNVGAADGGFFVLTRTGNGCMEDIREHQVFVGADGEIVDVDSVLVKRAAQRNCP